MSVHLLIEVPGASKVSLSTFSSEELWKRSGRLRDSNPEVASPAHISKNSYLIIYVQLFRLRDRKGADYLLSPTHEEEMTSLVGSIVSSYKELPLRLYQICSSVSCVSDRFNV